MSIIDNSVSESSIFGFGNVRDLKLRAVLYGKTTNGRRGLVVKKNIGEKITFLVSS